MYALVFFAIMFYSKIRLFCWKVVNSLRPLSTFKLPRLNTFTTKYTDICESTEKSQEISIRCALTGMNCYSTTAKKELLMNIAKSIRSITNQGSCVNRSCRLYFRIIQPCLNQRTKRIFSITDRHHKLVLSFIIFEQQSNSV